MNPELVAIAYHEAGHAALMHLYQQPITEVTIVPHEDYSGRATGPFEQAEFMFSAIEGTYLEEYEPEELDKLIRMRIQILYAGVAAEWIHTGTWDDDVASSDYEKIGDIALSHIGGYEDTSLFLEELREQTKNLLKENWLLVETIASALLSEQTITGEAIKQLLSGTVQSNSR